MKAYEQLVVSTTVKSLNSEIFKHGLEKAQSATVTITGGTLRYMTDGDNPSATKGLPVYDGDIIELVGFNDINLFRAIRAAAADVTLDIDYS